MNNKENIPPERREFESLIDTMLSPQVSASGSLTTYFKNYNNGNVRNCDDLNVDELLDIMCTPKQERSSQNTDTQTSTIDYSEEDPNKLLDIWCTPITPSISFLNYKEVSTQTDFNVLLTNRKELVETTTQTSFEIVERATTDTDKVPQILGILSENISVMPDEFKLFNNIDKIGTEKWAEYACKAVDKFCFNRRIMQEAQIEETQNTCSMYVDDELELDLKHSCQGQTVTYSINKTHKKNRNCLEMDQYMDNQELSHSQLNLRSSVDEIRQNKDLVSNNFNVKVVDKSKIRLKIHDVISKIYEALESGKVPVLITRCWRNRKNCVFKDNRLKCAPLKDAPLRKIRFKQRIFTRILYLLGKIYTLLGNRSKVTKRELFYQTKRIFTTSHQIDGTVDDVTHLLGIGQWNLNIVAHSGSVFGNLKLMWSSGESTNCNIATSIPYDLEDIVEIQCTAHFILVVEKESIFVKLLEEDIPKKLARPFLMITGKGMPDINTRLFLNKISTMMFLPIFILCDADIYGIKIMLAYRFGVASNCHLSDDLSVPNARWLGVFPSEISKYGLEYQTLNARDRKTIDLVSKYPYMEEHPEILEEIQVMARSNKKASIESVMKTDMFLSDSYLPTKFLNKDFI